MRSLRDRSLRRALQVKAGVLRALDVRRVGTPLVRTPKRPEKQAGRRPWQALARFHDWARRQEPEWRLGSITYRRKSEKVALRGAAWRFEVSIGGTDVEDGRVLYTSQVVMASSDLPPGQLGTRKHRAAFLEVARRLRPLGYSAHWFGWYGLFQGAFESFAALRKSIDHVIPKM